MFHLGHSLLTKLNRFDCLSEVRVLVHDVVEVGDLPLQGGLVVGRGDLNQVGPSQVSFETHHILHCVSVGASEQDLGVVLILNVHFHGGLDEGSHGYEPRLVAFF